MMDETVWNEVKTCLVDGLEEDIKEGMEKVFDLIHSQTNDPAELKVMLPIARRVYPLLRKPLEPKEFVDSFSEKILFTTESSVLKEVNENEGEDAEAELMASAAQIIAEQFDNE